MNNPGRHSNRRSAVATQLVPLAVADAYLAGVEDNGELAVVYAKHTTDIDGHAYVDVDACREADQFSRDAGEALAAYMEACEKFWANMAAGKEVGPYMATRRILAADRQRDNADLSEVYEEALELPVVGRGLDTALESEPELRAVDAIAAACGGEAVESQPGEMELSFYVDTAEQWVWGASLGGRPGPGEAVREVRFWVRHAKWRDRKVRRLTRVEVAAHELWPQP